MIPTRRRETSGRARRGPVHRPVERLPASHRSAGRTGAPPERLEPVRPSAAGPRGRTAGGQRRRSRRPMTRVTASAARRLGAAAGRRARARRRGVPTGAAGHRWRARRNRPSRHRDLARPAHCGSSGLAMAVWATALPAHALIDRVINRGDRRDRHRTRRIRRPPRAMPLSIEHSRPVPGSTCSLPTVAS